MDATGWGGLLTGAAAVIGAVWAVIADKKKNARESNHAKSFAETVTINDRADDIINIMLASIPHAKVISIAEWKNKDNPKRFRIDRSTDHNTWSIWRDYQVAEDNLIKIQAATLDEGVCLFRPTQLEDTVTKEWYEGNGLVQSSSLLIGVNDIIGQSRVLYISYSKEHIVSVETRKLIRLHLNQLHELYKPQGWLAKKNYLK